jgi:hypothetical protein
MTTEAQAIADVIAAEPPNANGNEGESTKDKFGRDAFERTVELTPEDAEGINREVEQGKHQSFDDGLHYVLARGFAEITRTRDAARKLFEQKMLKNKRDNWSKLLQTNPALLANADVMKSMLAELGITAAKTK